MVLPSFLFPVSNPLSPGKRCNRVGIAAKSLCIMMAHNPAQVLAPVQRYDELLANGIRVLQKTSKYIAISKPSGLLMHRTSLGSSHTIDREFLVDILRNSAIGAVFPVQRLDRATSGVLLLALSSGANAAKLQSALAGVTSQKEYWALASGVDMASSWTNSHALRDISSGRRREKRVVHREACTEFDCLGRFAEANVCVVRAKLRTGRRHQIRRHLSYSRHPIWGDTSYGKGVINRYVREVYAVQRCCLHARRLVFEDPWEEDLVTIEAPVPEDLRVVLRRLPGYSEMGCDVLDLGNG